MSNSEEEEEEDDESGHSSSSDTLTCSIPEVNLKYLRSMLLGNFGVLFQNDRNKIMTHLHIFWN